jgi:anthraniloyl-CoA monooxygenase
MRIAVLGGGPAGLYFALLMKKADPGHDIQVIERNPPDATFGWGVVFSEETLGAFRDADFETYTEITDTFARWGAIDVRYRGETVRSRGHVFSAISRRRLLEILQGRCRELGVKMEFERELAGPEELRDHDLVVAADGVNSLSRRHLAEQLRPTLDVHRTRFAWFGTDLVFDAFTFLFRENEHGLFQVHAYPFDASTSTFIVECPEAVWRRAGLDEATEEDSIAYCERLFAEDLRGRRLLSNRSVWISFVTVRCESWHHGNVVLLGDAAHTAHFTIGSGTKLAMEDAVSVAEALQRHSDVSRAALDYEMERQPVVERFQEAARESATYFENVRRYADFDPLQFTFNLLTRSGRITHLELEKRDPEFVRRVDGWFTATATGRPQAGSRVISPPPSLAPLRLRGVFLPNRVAVSPALEEDAVDGVPGGRARRLEAAGSGAGLVITELTAVSANGRFSPGTPGLYEDRHQDAWRAVVDEVHDAGSLVAVRLGHAGPRASCRPRRDGADRPLPDGGWPVVAASAVSVTPYSAGPEALTAGMDGVVEEYAASAARAADAGFDLLILQMAQGELLSSFLSPLLNRRTDAFGGSLRARMTFPVRVAEAVRRGWPDDRPWGVALHATDWARGGFEVEDAVSVARALRDLGCDLIQPLAGQTSLRSRPEYGRFFLVPFADRIRSEAGVATLVGGNLTTADEVNTILAAGRADLCMMELG